MALYFIHSEFLCKKKLLKVTVIEFTLFILLLPFTHVLGLS